MPPVEVSFLPQGQKVMAGQGSLLVEVAAKAGLLIDTPCGGQGRCGRCLVKVEQGEVQGSQNPHLSPQQVEEGWVLACQAKVGSSPLVITVPPSYERERLAVEGTTASKVALPSRCSFPLLPAVRRVFIELTPPSLQDNIADLERVKLALSQEHNIENFHLSLPQLRELASTLREDNWQFSLTLNTASLETQVIDFYPGRRQGPLLGLAIDIGTTNVVMDLVDLRTGKIVEQVSARNQQITRGDDVISRIVYAEKNRNGLSELQGLVASTINELIDGLAQRQKFQPWEIMEIVVAGNTIMSHIFLGLDPSYLRQEPYAPTATSFPSTTAAEVGLKANPRAPVYCLPSIAAYVGGDIVAGAITGCLFQTKKLTLFLDIGTNGEIVLGTADWLTTCACSAGPAFEGAGVRWGMRAVPGAIEEVRVSSKTLEPTVRVIGNVPPQGICGSGMISALAEMLITGIIDRSGKIDVEFVAEKTQPRPRARIGEHGPEYVFAWAETTASGQDIVLTGVDINNLIRTKAAIYAGIAVMARSLGLPLDQVEEVLIGGAFGQHINVEEAIHIGLLPDLPWERYNFLGNTSLAGAYHALVSKSARVLAEEIARKMTYFELIADNTFMNEFSAALFLPHTDMTLFPSVQAALEGAATLRRRL